MSADPPDPSDPLLAYPDFTAAVGERLEAGARAYGDASFSAHPSVLLDELSQESLDLAGWGYVLWKRLQAAQSAVREATAPREPLTYSGALKSCPLTVLVDSREQYQPTFPEGVQSERVGLAVADYSAASLSESAALELKWSIDDLAACVTGERERFETMLAKLAKYETRALIIADSQANVWRHRYHSRVKPSAILASTIGWGIDYRLPVVWADSTQGATDAIVWILTRALVKDRKRKAKAA